MRAGEGSEVTRDVSFFGEGFEERPLKQLIKKADLADLLDGSLRKRELAGFESAP